MQQSSFSSLGSTTELERMYVHQQSVNGSSSKVQSLEEMFMSYTNDEWECIGASSALSGTCSMVELNKLIDIPDSPTPMASDYEDCPSLVNTPKTNGVDLTSSPSPPAIQTPRWSPEPEAVQQIQVADSPSSLEQFGNSFTPPTFSASNSFNSTSFDSQGLPVSIPMAFQSPTSMYATQQMNAFAHVQYTVTPTFWLPPDQNMAGTSIAGPFGNQAGPSSMAPVSFPVQCVDAYGRSLMMAPQNYFLAPQVYHPMGIQPYSIGLPPCPTASASTNHLRGNQAQPFGPNGQFYPPAPVTPWPGQQVVNAASFGSNSPSVPGSDPWPTQQAGAVVAAPLAKRSAPPKQTFTFAVPTVPKGFVANPKNHGRWAFDKHGNKVYLNGPQKRLRKINM
ncbi:hypothetical protein N7495_003872 [Penicillium taxi]|uniref:uncharacterized protein n=1 Tax=Penicillium taxi TaxID=168475 RepID=UPI0025457D74|nr:uncharacterized protein N7495_003872 [Penicillium taxi]KAJ5899128.1 hypothetical protein N7495_003872 [Penicillium taxi]